MFSIKIGIKIERIRFADSWLAKLLIKLARWRNWKPNSDSYISETRWNFRLASKIATYLKTREENREADKYKKSISPGVLELVTRPEKGTGAGFDRNAYNNLLKNKNEPS